MNFGRQRPVLPSDLLDWLSEIVEENGKKSDEVIVAVRECATWCKVWLETEGHEFRKWCRRATRNTGIAEQKIAHYASHVEADAHGGARVTDSWDAWARRQRLSWHGGLLRRGGAQAAVEDVLAQARVDMRRWSARAIDDAYTLWCEARKAEAWKRLQEQLRHRSLACDAVSDYVRAVTGSIDDLDLSAVRHFVWQVKGSSSGLALTTT